MHLSRTVAGRFFVHVGASRDVGLVSVEGAGLIGCASSRRGGALSTAKSTWKNRLCGTAGSSAVLCVALSLLGRAVSSCRGGGRREVAVQGHGAVEGVERGVSNRRMNDSRANKRNKEERME